ncbi:ATP-binding protein [Pseudomonas mangrovi]|uniref:ATP-binding protein n=1 Tax=Pseudomonas mangrovi TaxID=2161748 RepID=UPI0018EFA03C|nr:ATP-binding protein [Pseudomonas mangrovi]
MNQASSPDPLYSVFPGDSEVARHLRGRDWSQDPLGPPTGWPEALRHALRIMLVSRAPMWVGWGEDTRLFYNDGCRGTMGERHPHVLGRPLAEVLVAAGSPLHGHVRKVRESGRGTWDPSLALILTRGGYAEETYHNISCNPLFDEKGGVAGVLCYQADDTERVINERRLATLSRLASNLGKAESRSALFQAIADTLGENPQDLPFAMVYVFNDAGSAWLASASGIERSHPCAAASLDELQLQQWQLDRLWESEEAFELPLGEAAQPLPCGAWDRPPQRIAVVALAGRELQRPNGALVVGLNPYRPRDLGYLGFIGLVAGQIGATLARVDAIEAERRRVEVLAEVAWIKQEAAESLRLVNEGLTAEVEQRTAERDRLHALFQQAPGFICVLRGPQHVFEQTNEAFQRIVGPRHLVGLTVREAMPELENQGFVELLDGVYRSGVPYVGRNMPIRLQRAPLAPLEQLHVHFVYQPILEADGSVSGIFVEGNDVSDQIHAEEALRRLNETLESKVNERTIALAEALQRLRDEASEREAAQEALRQSQKMEAVGQLTGGIAHDFNNMLTGVIGSLEMMQRRIAAGRLDDIERYVEAAGASANRAAALTHRLLAFSRRQPLAPVPADANRLLLAMEELLRRSIGENVELLLQPASELWSVLCDANQLENAILNLALNARDAMPAGGRLSIATSNLCLEGESLQGSAAPVSGEFVRLSVSDSGTGMPAHVIERAFEPFYTTKAIGKGTGLGLSMVYGFARQSEGYVTIDSEVGSGTRVSLYLPRHHGRQGRLPVVTRSTGEQRANGEVVLVVEDQEAVRRLVVEVLNELGCRTLEAADGPGGLEILESATRIDLLLTDIGLPGINGRLMSDVARMQRPTLKVLFMTGYAAHGVLPDGMLKSGMGLLTKPFSVEMLSSRVLEMLAEGDGAELD